jgi:MFS family permease
MNAGLPGIGLSGVFYILSALLMPVAEAARAVRGRPRRRSWSDVLAHWTIAAAMIAAMWSAGFGVTVLLRAAGHDVRDGNLWRSLLFIMIPFAIVFVAVTLIGRVRRRTDRSLQPEDRGVGDAVRIDSDRRREQRQITRRPFIA